MKSVPHLSSSYCYFVSPRIKTRLVASLQFPILDFLSNHAADESSKSDNCNITLFSLYSRNKSVYCTLNRNFSLALPDFVFRGRPS